MNSTPSRNPSNDDSLTGMLREVHRKTLQATDDMLPAIVRAYDRDTNRARVQPLIQLLTTQGERVSRADIPSVPVLLLGGGGFFASFHLPEGALGWIKACDRDISLFLSSYAESGPNTERLHTFEDALFIPDIMTGFTIAGEDNEAALIQNLEGTVRISLTNERIKMTSPRVEIVTGSNTIVIEDGHVTISNADMTINGNVQINGTLDTTGNITSASEVTAKGVKLTNHKHSGVSSGGATTGPPV